MEQTNQTGADCTSCHHSMLGHKHGAITLVLVLLAAFLLALTIKTVKEVGYVGGGIAPTNAISVSGVGEAVAVPDTAEFTFSIIEEGATAAAVRDAATKKEGDAIKALKEKGIEDKDIKTVAYELAPKYEWKQVGCVRYPCESKQVQVGFALNQSVRVKVRDLDKAGEMLEALTSKGVQSVGGLTFTIDDEDKIKSEARKVAIENARAKADKLAADLGVTLVRIVGFSEDGNYPMPYYEAAVSADTRTMVKSTPVVPAGENQVTSNVTITYEIR